MSRARLRAALHRRHNAKPSLPACARELAQRLAADHHADERQLADALALVEAPRTERQQLLPLESSP